MTRSGQRRFPCPPGVVLVLTVLALPLAGCASTTPIGELLADPGHYDGETVQVEGEVQGAFGGLGAGAYRLEDDTGTLTVVSESSTPPTSGARVRVKGVFEALFSLGSESLAVLREESRTRP